jgi:hypothetical protein
VLTRYRERSRRLPAVRRPARRAVRSTESGKTPAPTSAGIPTLPVLLMRRDAGPRTPGSRAASAPRRRRRPPRGAALLRAHPAMAERQAEVTRWARRARETLTPCPTVRPRPALEALCHQVVAAPPDTPEGLTGGLVWQPRAHGAPTHASHRSPPSPTASSPPATCAAHAHGRGRYRRVFTPRPSRLLVAYRRVHAIDVATLTSRLWGEAGRVRGSGRGMKGGWCARDGGTTGAGNPGVTFPGSRFPAVAGGDADGALLPEAYAGRTDRLCTRQPDRRARHPVASPGSRADPVDRGVHLRRVPGGAPSARGAAGKSTLGGAHFPPDAVVCPSGRLRAVVGRRVRTTSTASVRRVRPVLEERRPAAGRGGGFTTVVDTLGLDADRRTALVGPGPGSTVCVRRGVP